MRDISFIRLDSRALPPRRAREGDAGFDLFTVEDVTLSPGQRSSVGTGIALALPFGTAGLVLPRSGHAARHGISLANGPGLIDAGYRGEIRVLLINHGAEMVTFTVGDRIAQLVVIDLAEVAMVETTELTPSDRGDGGFGSTGT
jgi:dUTP pyrophosphatase